VAGANEQIHFLVGFEQGVQFRFDDTDDAFHLGAVDAVVFDTVDVMSAHTLFARCVAVKIIQQVIGADHLIVVYGLHQRNPFFLDPVNDGGGQLEVDVVHMNDVRAECINNLHDFLFCFERIDDLEGVEESAESCSVEVHVLGVESCGVSHGVLLVKHPEKLHFMTEFLQMFGKIKHITFASTARVEEFIYHQNSHKSESRSSSAFAAET